MMTDYVFPAKNTSCIDIFIKIICKFCKIVEIFDN